MLLEIPCLHRLNPNVATHVAPIQQSLGLAPDLEVIVERLKERNHQVKIQRGTIVSHYVTFDDRWNDVYMLREFFADLHYLQPVIFLTDQQLEGKQTIIPLHRLYKHCKKYKLSLEQMVEQGISRTQVKSLPEQEQHRLRDDFTISRYSPNKNILSIEQIKELQENEWLVGAHGENYHDMRDDSDQDFFQSLTKSLTILQKHNSTQWFVWPEVLF